MSLDPSPAVAPGGAGGASPSDREKYGLLHPNTIPGKIEQLVDPVLKGVAMFFYVIFNVVFPVLPFLIDFLINGTKPTPPSNVDPSAPFRALDGGSHQTVSDTYERTPDTYDGTPDAYRAAKGSGDDVEAAYDANDAAFDMLQAIPNVAPAPAPAPAPVVLNDARAALHAARAAVDAAVNPTPEQEAAFADAYAAFNDALARDRLARDPLARARLARAPASASASASASAVPPPVRKETQLNRLLAQGVVYLVYDKDVLVGYSTQSCQVLKRDIINIEK